MASTYFSSRKGFVLGSLLWGILGASFLGLLWAMKDEMGSASSYLGLGIMTLTCAFVAVIWWGTGYEIKEHNLVIRVGPFSYTPIPIEKIRLLSRSHSWLSAPANSTTRIRVVYGQYSEVLISPEREQDFVAAIQRVNPDVQVEINDFC